jgi:hypothetical protein
MFRDRIKELRRVPASQLKAHPKNWRKHPPKQQAALRAVLKDVGYAGAILVRELDDGSLQILDGHLRAETSPDQLVPVLVLDVSAAEADKILATHDTVTLLAESDFARLDDLAASCRLDSPDLAAVFRELDELARASKTDASARDATHKPEAPAKAHHKNVNIVESFQIVVACDSELSQQRLYERLVGEGYACRVLGL